MSDAMEHIARVLARLEKVHGALRNATLSVKTASVTLPTRVIEHYRDQVDLACRELRTVDGGGARRAVSKADRSAILLRAWPAQRDGYVCAQCDRTTPHEQDMEVDHIVPLARGGANERANLQALCRACNRAKAAA